MAPLIRISNPIELGKLTNVMQIRGVDTYVHWSVFAVAAFILAGVVRQPGLTLLGLLLYLSVLLIHECGHLIAAQRKGCRVQSIQIYPIFGITRFETPWSRVDHCIVAWGGVLAQAIVFIPLVAWVAMFGYPQKAALAMIFAILGFFSLAVAVFNLLPIPPLDGSIAWGIVPALLAERRSRISRKPTQR